MAAFPASSCSLLFSRSEVSSTLQSWRACNCFSFSASSKCHSSRQPVRHPIRKLQAVEDFAEPSKVGSYLNTLGDNLQEISPKSLKGFPWEEAKDMVLHRSISLGENALKWSFIGLYAFSTLSDFFLAIYGEKELLIPIGLFIGVALADFLKNFLQVFHPSSKDEDLVKFLLGIGSFFVSVKFVSLGFKMQGRVLLSHIGNGGLMQVLWLARKLQQTDDFKDENTESTNGPSISS